MKLLSWAFIGWVALDIAFLLWAWLRSCQKIKAEQRTRYLNRAMERIDEVAMAAWETYDQPKH